MRVYFNNLKRMRRLLVQQGGCVGLRVCQAFLQCTIDWRTCCAVGASRPWRRARALLFSPIQTSAAATLYSPLCAGRRPICDHGWENHQVSYMSLLCDVCTVCG